ncbi:23S rRNA (pseudouridine(1915)-N(3))-methyltransferase RlmH [bacterium]|nr:23S rRNA (pseudouridine(1915)-N(3))-methyltransferase RlmH [bacterium]
MLKITIITIGNKMPSWVDQAVKEFTKRLQDGIAVTIVEIPLMRRGKSSDITRIMDKEMQLMSAAIPTHARLIALDITGKAFTSEQLAGKIQDLQQITSHLCFLIGGPEGLSPELVARSDERWSMSMLTLPHTLVRIVLLEALYRAWSILHNHPYHK